MVNSPESHKGLAETRSDFCSVATARSETVTKVAEPSTNFSYSSVMVGIGIASVQSCSTTLQLRVKCTCRSLQRYDSVCAVVFAFPLRQTQGTRLSAYSNFVPESPGTNSTPLKSERTDWSMLIPIIHAKINGFRTTLAISTCRWELRGLGPVGSYKAFEVTVEPENGIRL